MIATDPYINTGSCGCSKCVYHFKLRQLEMNSVRLQQDLEAFVEHLSEQSGKPDSKPKNRRCRPHRQFNCTSPQCR